MALGDEALQWLLRTLNAHGASVAGVPSGDAIFRRVIELADSKSAVVVAATC